MAIKKQSRGQCSFCKKEMSNGGLKKHLSNCLKRLEAVSHVKGKSKEQELYHLQVQDAWRKEFWLHLEVKDSDELIDLDHYLRSIWLECCGHLSQFSIGGWGGEKISKTRKIKDIFKPEIVLTHIYDFGTSSETLIKFVDIRKGKALSKYPIYLMGRNNPPDTFCMECDRVASWLCMECEYEHDQAGTLCDVHVETHPHDSYGDPLPIVNSPRTGLCGYSGPAEPPY